MDWIKIHILNKVDIFFTEDISVQLSTGSHSSIYITFDISKYPEYDSYFLKLYESQQTSSKKFIIESPKFIGHGSIIKSIDTDFKTKINLTIRCELIKDIQERRNEIIEELLNKETYTNKNNIN